ncbi:alpha/beta-hydrolase [Thozetella sp. PMI_491]|nr:alpha/beta-hydrolase [Thozetella sp. PMI_491]
MNTASVSLAVTPTVVSTLLSHYLNRKPLRQKPTAHLSYDEGLNLIRSFLVFASHHTVEDLQAFTAQWVPHPQWIRVEEVDVPSSDLDRAAGLLEQQLGPDGIKEVGGSNWWQWRKAKSPLKAEWIEMKADHREREKNGDPGNRVMFYVHGGAYFFGSVDEHRYQMQRHARKLKARAFAPRYRLSPQFPFPCGLHDCLAAYLYLLRYQEPQTILLAGDSAGGGMVVSMLVTLRDRGIPLPAGAVLISPWVDLTHSFPSVAGACPCDYIPQSGFHHKPSAAWPPPSDNEIEELKRIIEKKKASSTEASNQSSHAPDNMTTAKTHLSVTIDGKQVEIKEQIQLYTTNELLSHPLVSPVMQPTLGGLPPLLIMVGGGEILRDEQIYLAHKCAHPQDYLPTEALMDDKARAQLEAYKPTDVQLQVWDDLCHVAPTLSFTRPAKYMYRSIAQFGAWALARAQQTEIDILDDDDISVISSSDSEGPDEDHQGKKSDRKSEKQPQTNGSIGKAGDPLPNFKDHMIRQRVTRHGVVYPLPPPEELEACVFDREHVGVVKAGPVRKWLEQRERWDARFKKTKMRVYKKRMNDLQIGYEVFPQGDIPPPSALAGRRKIDYKESEKKRARSLGLSLWSLWGSKHDEATVQREEQAEKAPEMAAVTEADGQGARAFPDIQEQASEAHRVPPAATQTPSVSRSRSRRRTVKDEGQVGDAVIVDEDTPAATLLAFRKENGESTSGVDGLLSPNYVPDTGVTGKRPRIDGISMPFTISKEADTASMMTLTSAMDASGLPSPRPTSPAPVETTSAAAVAEAQGDSLENGTADAASSLASPNFLSPLSSPSLVSPTNKPRLERFVTAEEETSREPAADRQKQD